MEPKGNQMDPRGSQMDPKGSQMDPKGSQRRSKDTKRKPRGQDIYSQTPDPPPKRPTSLYIRFLWIPAPPHSSLAPLRWPGAGGGRGGAGLHKNLLIVGRLGGGSGVCEYIACPLGFLLVSLERLWFPLARLWVPFGSLWGPFGSPWAPFGRLWAPFGSLWGSIWVPLGCPWGPWGLLGLPKGIF